MDEPALKRLEKVPGETGKQNDVIFCGGAEIANENVVYFGGDIQDFQEAMEKHRDNRHYTSWSLDNTARLLQRRFHAGHVWVVRPRHMSFGTFATFGNFLISDPQGVPEFQSDKALCLPHLSALLAAACDRQNEEFGDSFCSPDRPLRLIGFSKGCTVLNQLLYELPLFPKTPKDAMPPALQKLEKLVWLDGGHGGADETWVTNQQVLRDGLAEICVGRELSITALSTPYQVKDPLRSWVGRDHKKFVETLKKLKVPLEARTLFPEEMGSIQLHFQLLAEF